MIYDNEVEVLRNILANSTGKSVAQMTSEISAVVSKTETLQALVVALTGDNRPLNELLFRNGESTESPLVWVAPIKATEPKYVWMIGRANERSLVVHTWFDAVRDKLAKDSLIKQHLISPPLLFVDPEAISSVTLSELEGEDEFAIFQTGYEQTPDEVSDLNQRMVINMKYSLTKRMLAQDRLERIFGSDNELVRCCRDNLELFAILHNEGHNQGHFVGSWPHEDTIKKNTVLYEAVEEFRACVAAVLLAEYLPLSHTEKKAFALSVFATRCLGFGFDAYCLSEQRRETAREIVVGLFFFESFIKDGVFKVSSSSAASMFIDVDKILQSLRSSFKAIDDEESLLDQKDGDGLRRIATEWYKFAFPNGDYSQAAKNMYSMLQERR